MLAPRTAQAVGDADLDLGLTDVAVVLTPNPRVSIDTASSVAYPGDEIVFEASFLYDQATLAVSADLTAENIGDVAGTIAYVSVVWEKRETGQSTWTEFAGASLTSPDWAPVEPMAPYLDPLSFTGLGEAATGVEYPALPVSIIGTELEPEAIAAWRLSATVPIPSQSTLLDLFDDAEIDGIRQVVHLEIDPRDEQLGQAFSESTDITAAIQSTSPDLEHGEITVRLPDDTEVVFDEGDVAALATIELGDEPINEEAPFEVDDWNEKGNLETDAEYLHRLRAIEPLAGSVTFVADTYAGTTEAVEFGEGSHLDPHLGRSRGGLRVDAGRRRIWDIAVSDEQRNRTSQLDCGRRRPGRRGRLGRVATNDDRRWDDRRDGPFVRHSH